MPENKTAQIYALSMQHRRILTENQFESCLTHNKFRQPDRSLTVARTHTTMRPRSMHCFQIGFIRESLIYSVLSFPRRQEPGQIKALVPRFCGE